MPTALETNATRFISFGTLWASCSPTLTSKVLCLLLCSLIPAFNNLFTHSVFLAVRVHFFYLGVALEMIIWSGGESVRKMCVCFLRHEGFWLNATPDVTFMSAKSPRSTLRGDLHELC